MFRTLLNPTQMPSFSGSPPNVLLSNGLTERLTRKQHNKLALPFFGFE